MDQHSIPSRPTTAPDTPQLSRQAEEILSKLTPRERLILTLFLQGYTAKHIAGYLGCDLGTVSTHKARFMRKLNIRSDVALGIFGVGIGLIPPVQEPAATS